MIIGVDAGALSIRDDRLKVGVYRVTLNLLKELAKIDTKNDYRLYSFLPIDKSVMNECGANMQNVVVRPTFGWSAIQLPIELMKHPVNVFLGLSQMVPRPLTPERSDGERARSVSHNIGFIYDLGFLHYPDAYPGSLTRLQKQTGQLTKRADHIVCISQTTKTDVRNFYKLPNDTISVSYPGIDERFKVKGNLYKNKNPYFLFVGALKRGKNIPFMLQSFADFLKINKKQYDLLLIGGDYWLDPEINTTIKTLDLEHRVKIKGFVIDRDLPSYYRGAEALLITSFWEGFCMPAVEAMASGCPVIYARSGSMPEIVGAAGISFGTDEKDEAVKSLTKISTNFPLRKKLISAGIKRSEEFTWLRFARSIYRIISSE